MPPPIKLRGNDWKAVLATSRNVQHWHSQREQLMRAIAEAEREHKETLADIERDYKLEPGSVERGEWAILDGHLVCQKQPQRQPEKQEEGVKENAA